VPPAEFQQALSAAGNGGREQQALVLQRVVDQKLFAQAARREKLDRDLSVVQAIEAAKREILASAYAERLMSSLSPPSEEQIDAFYHDHPELFSARRILSLDEVAVSGDPAQVAELRTRFTGSGGKLDVVQALLARRGVATVVAHVRLAPEQLDMVEASHLSRLKVGDSVIYQMAKDTHFAIVTAEQKAPLSFAQAEPQIRKLLVTQARRAAVDKEGARLQAAAHLIYAKGYAPVTPAGT